MYCGKCGTLLSDPDHIEELTAEHAAHNDNYVDIKLITACGAEYSQFVPFDDLVLTSMEAEDAR